MPLDQSGRLESRLMGSRPIEVRLNVIRYEAQGIHSFELRPLHGSTLPAFAAGAHVDLHLPNGLVRSYSLLNPLEPPDRYCIAVNNDPASRGGSRLLHEQMRVGQTLTIGEPRNNFALEEAAQHSVLIAGGIGITPLFAMVQRLTQIGRPWSLFFAARTRAHMAFLTELTTLAQSAGNHLVVHADDEHGGQPLDVRAILAGRPATTHWYCCGPLPMLEVFERETAALPAPSVHVEFFAPREPAALAGGFTVRLARSNRSVPVLAGQTILDALLAAGLDVVPYSCCEGVCGTCETKVLAGLPDHRDLVLTKAERAENRTMMVCCSGSRSDVLVLDR